MTKSTATSRKLGRNAQHTFHLMVSGHSHSGKSSFCRTLAHSLAHSDDARLLINAPNSANDNGVASVIEENLLLADNLHLLFDKPAPLYRNNNNNSANTSSKDIISPTPLSGDIEFGYEYGGIGERVRLRLIDTPGLAIPVNIHKEMASSPSIHHESIATAWTNSISSYIEKIFEKTLMEESKVKRNRKNPDHHVHALIYLLDPMVIAACKGLTPIDILCMTALCSRVNLVPVIAKTDLLSVKQLASVKKFIMDDITRHEIPIQFFDEMVNEEDEEDEGMDNHHRHHHSSSSSHPHMHPDSQFAKEYDFSLRSVYPFTLINSEEGGDGQVGIFDENGKPFLGRLFPWGAAQTENLAHCDFLRIKELLFATHLEDFKTSTKEVLYENWRTEKLLKVRESMQADHQGPPRGREEKIQRQDFRS